MTLAALRLALWAAAVVPSVALAFQWSGRAGMGYVRDDIQRAGAATVTVPRLDLDLSLDARGFVYQPDAVTWSGGFEYRRLSVGVAGGEDTVENRLEYRLQTVLFGRRTSPITLSAFASRGEGDGSATGIVFGSTTQTYGGTLALRLPNRPLLEGGYTHTESDVTSSIRADARTVRDAFSAGTAHSGAIYGFGATYRGNFSEGTFDADDYDDHRVDVNARVRMSGNTSLQVVDAFFRRNPTTDSPFNPRQELNVFSAALRHEEAPGPDVQRITYSHTAALTESVALPVSRTLQQLEYQIERAVRAPEWLLVGTARANLDDRLLGEERERSAGQSLGATLSWRRRADDRSVEVHGGPSVGLLEPFDGSVELGWGANAGAGLQRVWGRLTGGAQYSVAYASTLGTSGTSLFQQGSLTADGALGLARLRGQLQLNADRTNDRLFGSRASRSLLARGEYARRRYALWLDADARDGVANPLRSPIGGDGLFLAPAYDTHTRSVGAGARGTLGTLSASASARMINADLPDRPAQNDLELRAELSYRLGAFGLSVEDRYVTALDSGGDRARVNVLYLRVFRLLGSGP